MSGFCCDIFHRCFCDAEDFSSGTFLAFGLTALFFLYLTYTYKKGTEITGKLSDDVNSDNRERNNDNSILKICCPSDMFVFCRHMRKKYPNQAITYV